MAPAGRQGFEARLTRRPVSTSEEGQQAALSPEYEQRLRANAAAARYRDAKPPWYRRTASHWVLSAKREEDARAPSSSADRGLREERDIKPPRLRR